MNFVDDIPMRLAQEAHQGTSFVPERRGESVRNEYAQTLAADYARLERLADDHGKREMLAKEFARYREGYRTRTIRWLAARGRMVSPMIAGPSGFPVERMRKIGDAAHKRLTELLEYRERALAAITKTLCPELRPIMSGDADAADRLREKIAEAEKMQDRRKATNRLIRRFVKSVTPSEVTFKEANGRVACILALQAEGYSDGEASRLLTPDFCGRIGYADYEMTNNNANIRRMKERLERIERAKATPDTTIEGAAARIEDCPAENRVRLFFPGKPGADVRGELKRTGFRWTPSLGCWQAYRNSRTLQKAAESCAALSLPAEYTVATL